MANPNPITGGSPRDEFQKFINREILEIMRKCGSRRLKNFGWLDEHWFNGIAKRIYLDYIEALEKGYPPTDMNGQRWLYEARKELNSLFLGLYQKLIKETGEELDQRIAVAAAKKRDSSGEIKALFEFYISFEKKDHFREIMKYGGMKDKYQKLKDQLVALANR